MKNLTEEQTGEIEGIVGAQMDLMYSAVADHFELESGDVSPNHVFEMDDLKLKIRNLMSDYVLANVPELTENVAILITEFMGGKHIPKGHGKLECIVIDIWGQQPDKTIEEIHEMDNYTYLIEDVRFHESWDWLMPVVDKIKWMMRGNDEAHHILDRIDNSLSQVDIVDTLSYIVEFIKWYNANK